MRKTLKLTLKKKWFDMIASGEKKEEYREIKQYWLKRITGGYVVNASDGSKCDDLTAYSTIAHNIDLLSGKWLPMKFDRVLFTNGYAKNAPKIEFEGIDIYYGEGRPEWGANSGTIYFVIKLGREIKRTDLKY